MLTSVRARTRTHQSARSTSVLIIDARFQVSGSLDLWQATAAWSTLDRKMTMARRMVAISVGAALCGVNGNMIDVILPEMVPPANCPHGCMEVCSWRAKQSRCPEHMHHLFERAFHAISLVPNTSTRIARVLGSENHSMDDPFREDPS